MKKIIFLLLITTLLLTSSMAVSAEQVSGSKEKNSDTHQDHCFCGGELTVGEHTKHKTFDYQPWDGKSNLPYKNNVAYVYLTNDIKRTKTLQIGGGKTLSLCLNGHTIQKEGGGRVINIVSGGKLRICDCSTDQSGKITGGKHQMGGGIHNGGTLVMYGGKVTGNGATYGGGLWNNYNFYMYGGEITGNKASYGGGIWNANSGNAEMVLFGGSINANKATYGGGVWNNDNGNLTMQGGDIMENVATRAGGGLWHQGTNFFLKDGYIYKNHAWYGAGVWTQSAFTMTGGYIVANEASFINDDGELDGCGGGVWVNDKSGFYMKAGDIQGNTAGGYGGGVWVNDTGEFIMQGGTISGNMAQYGAGAFLQRHERGGGPGIFYIGGNASVHGNKAKWSAGGMYVKGILEKRGGKIDGNFCIEEPSLLNLVVDPQGEVRKGTVLPTQFLDVPADAYYCKPVLWALQNEIASGTSELTFSPDEKCNTAQVLTFVWRAAGSPNVGNKYNFADVRKTDYFYQPAQWAYSLGILEGTALYPNFSCNRMGAVYYIWCAAGRPACKTPLKFTDVNQVKYAKYCEAIAWAVEKGIASGTSDTTFGPGKTCTRAEIITFLWKAVSIGAIG